MKPQINLHNPSYNLTDGEMPMYWAMKEREFITQEMIELAKLQKQTNKDKQRGIERAIQDPQEYINTHYDILSRAWAEVKFIQSIYLQ